MTALLLGTYAAVSTPTAAFTFCGPAGTAPDGEYLEVSTWKVYWYDQETDCLTYLRDYEVPAGGVETQGGESQDGECHYVGADWDEGGVWGNLGSCLSLKILRDPLLGILTGHRFDMRKVLGAAVTRAHDGTFESCYTTLDECPDPPPGGGGGFACGISTTVAACHIPYTQFPWSSPPSGEKFCIRLRVTETNPFTGSSSTIRVTDYVCQA